MAPEPSHYLRYFPKQSGRALHEHGLTVFIKYLFNPYTINAATKAKMA